jgi:protein-disulfide isomerase
VDAPVLVHIFSDFECPYCRNGEETLEQLEERFPGKLRFVWHDFPLDFHERARPAARAGREVYEKKGSAAFWKMHRMLFGLDGDVAQLSTQEILAHGRQLGLDERTLEEALSGTKHDAFIDAEIDEGAAHGIRGTPAYVIGGYLVVGAKPLRYLERVTELALREHATADEAKGGAAQ